MNLKKTLKVASLVLAGVFFLTACSQSSVTSSSKNNAVPVSTQQQKQDKTSKEFTLEAKETQIMYNEKLTDTAYTYNGTVPGPEIKVTEGDKVTIHFKNSLKEDTTLHLHGINIENKMDGVPDITQKSIKPRETFDYKFTAPAPGTYWYHSHFNETTQIGNGLYGVLIVEPKNGEKFAVDKTVVISEMSSLGSMNMDSTNMGSMDMNHSNMGHTESHTQMMNNMYDTELINGKASPKIEPLKVKKGDSVKLRFLNTGLYTQDIQIPEHEFKVTGYDGSTVNSPDLIKGQLLAIAPGERYDVEFKADQPNNWGVKVYAETNKEKLNAYIPLVYQGYEDKKQQDGGDFNKLFDFTSYGKPDNKELPAPTKKFDMILGTNDGGNTFTINSKKMPNPEVYDVTKGDIVQMTIKNQTNVDHPMHLHGHHFYVLSKNGKKVSGSDVIKDTLNVRPNETYVIQFVADNPGNWLFHCHELHHAESGMVSLVKYK